MATFSWGVKIRKLLLFTMVLLLVIPSYSSSYEVNILTPLNKIIEKLSPSDWIKEDQIAVHFELPQRAITPGQSIVFYQGSEVIGGGIIQ